MGLTVLFVSACDDDTQVSPANLPDAGPSVEAGPPPARVEDLLEPLHASSGVPGLAALVLRDGSVIAEGAVGVRKTDDPTPVSADDVWYLGTATEAITATLAALVVEEGKLDWSSTLGAILADLPMHAAYKDVSLADLLTHRAGAPATLSDAVALALGQGDGSAQAHRDDRASAQSTRRRRDRTCHPRSRDPPRRAPGLLRMARCSARTPATSSPPRCSSGRADRAGS